MAGRGDGVGEAAAALEDGVERGLGGERTAGPEPGDEAAHEARVGGGEHVVGQAERLGDAGAPVREEHVGLGDELEERVATRRVLEIEHAPIASSGCSSRTPRCTGSSGRPYRRNGSPFAVSILITSAPRSASIIPAYGPGHVDGRLDDLHARERPASFAVSHEGILPDR